MFARVVGSVIGSVVAVVGVSLPAAPAQADTAEVRGSTVTVFAVEAPPGPVMARSSSTATLRRLDPGQPRTRTVAFTGASGRFRRVQEGRYRVRVSTTFAPMTQVAAAALTQVCQIESVTSGGTGWRDTDRYQIACPTPYGVYRNWMSSTRTWRGWASEAVGRRAVYAVGDSLPVSAMDVWHVYGYLPAITGSYDWQVSCVVTSVEPIPAEGQQLAYSDTRGTCTVTVPDPTTGPIAPGEHTGWFSVGVQDTLLFGPQYRTGCCIYATPAAGSADLVDPVPWTLDPATASSAIVRSAERVRVRPR